MKSFYFACFFVAILSAKGMAYDFADEDLLYSKRGDASPADFSPLERAVQAYKKAIKDHALTGVDLVYAGEQIARLHAYKTQMLISKSLVLQAANACLNDLEQIKPGRGNLSAHPAYFYWAGVCRLAWADARQDMEALDFAPELADLIQKGERLDPTYEGGGLGALKVSFIPTFLTQIF